jgi:hypothetical protein
VDRPLLRSQASPGPKWSSTDFHRLEEGDGAIEWNDGWKRKLGLHGETFPGRGSTGWLALDVWVTQEQEGLPGELIPITSCCSTTQTLKAGWLCHRKFWLRESSLRTSLAVGTQVGPERPTCATPRSGAKTFVPVGKLMADIMPSRLRKQLEELNADRFKRYVTHLCHAMTIAARDTYVPGTFEVEHPVTLRKLNETQHRLTSILVDLLDSAPHPKHFDMIVAYWSGAAVDEKSRSLAGWCISEAFRGSSREGE